MNKNDLSGFIGSQDFYSLGAMFPGFVMTEGVHYVEIEGNANWLISDIAACQLHPNIRKEPFQVWKLEKDGDRATLSCEDGNDNRVYTQKYGYTDFPLDSLTLYLTCDENPPGKLRRTLMLPSEY